MTCGLALQEDDAPCRLAASISIAARCLYRQKNTDITVKVDALHQDHQHPLISDGPLSELEATQKYNGMETI